ncbi:MAG: alpha/beta fold hydrolase [Thermoleophilia bacterium]|nr:alpha/beta fold hydrolase [Thermoleophilia bacterium]
MRHTSHTSGVARPGRATYIVGVMLVLALVCLLSAAACDGGRETAAASADSTSVSFNTADGVTLRGHLFGSGSSGVILCHMYPADQASWFAAAARLAGEGYRVLTFDFRGYGESDGEKDIQHLDKDVSAAIGAFSLAGVGHMVLVGASMGGTASLISAESWQTISRLQMAGVIALSAPVEFRGLDAAEVVPRLVIPMLFIAAEDDSGADGARRLRQLSGDTGDLYILPGDDHGTDLLDGPVAEEVWSLLLTFLRETLPAAGQ